MQKKAAIVGFGNIFGGDFGFGCYVVDALRQEPLGESIDLVYLAGDGSCTDAYIYGAQLVIFVQAMPLGGYAGAVSCWDKKAFFKNLPWLMNESISIHLLAKALTRMEMVGATPEELLFLWLEPGLTEGFGISGEVKKSMRKAIQIIKRKLVTNGFLPEETLNHSFIYQLNVLGTTV